MLKGYPKAVNWRPNEKEQKHKQGSTKHYTETKTNHYQIPGVNLSAHGG